MRLEQLPNPRPRRNRSSGRLYRSGGMGDVPIHRSVHRGLRGRKARSISVACRISDTEAAAYLFSLSRFPCSVNKAQVVPGSDWASSRFRKIYPPTGNHTGRMPEGSIPLAASFFFRSYALLVNFAAIFVNCSNAASRSSAISVAMVLRSRSPPLHLFPEVMVAPVGRHAHGGQGDSGITIEQSKETVSPAALGCNP